MIPYPFRHPPATIHPRWTAMLGAFMLATLLLQPLPVAVGPWLAWSALYVVVETATARRLLFAGGAGWPVLVAMATLLEPDRALLGAGLAVAAAAVVSAATGRRGVAGARFLAHLPPLSVVALTGAAAGDLPVAMGAAGMIAGMASHLLARHLAPSPWPIVRVLAPGGDGEGALRAAGLGGTAALLGVVAGSGGGVGMLAATGALLVVAAADHTRRRLETARHQGVAALLAALEAKDLYTRGHSVRVAELCALVADDLGLPGRRRRILVTAALLHDIGKIAVPTTLLRKPGRLTADEYRKVQEHTDAAAVILDGVGFLSPVIPVVSEHHVHYDGGGYGGSAAPPSLEARILAVTDGFDAMTSHRPYRGALSREYAVAELRRQAGTQFDPVVVEALVRRLAALGATPLATGAVSETEARSRAEVVLHG